MNACELKIGDELLDTKQNVLIVEDAYFEICKEPVLVYNFEVEDFHTYHVGNILVLVHNANDYINPQTTHVSELDIDKIQTTKNDGTIATGGRSGANRPFDGTPNSYVNTEAGHKLVYGADGKLNIDISPNRVKGCVWDQAPNGIMHPRDMKLMGDVPPELLTDW